MQARYIQRGESIDFLPDRDIAAGEIVISIDFLPDRDIAAGEIVIRNGLIGVARIPVKKGTLGSLALSGVFDVTKPVRCAFSVGAAVYWDAVRQSAVTSGELLLGLAAESSKLSKLNDSHVRVILNSGGITISNNEATLNWQTIN